MAVIIRDRLTGEAKNIADQAFKKTLGMGNQAAIALQQQKSMLGGAQQVLVSQATNALEQTSSNAYRASRQLQAEAAASGVFSDAQRVAKEAQVQDMMSADLTQIVNSAEVGATELAGQQSALNKAELQIAAPAVFDTWADELIKSGVAKRDRGREALAGITGALTGAIKGVLGGGVAVGSTKKLLDPTTGFISKVLSGGALLGAGAFGANDIGNLVNTGNINYGTGTELYNKNAQSQAMQWAIAGGAVAGAGLGAFDRFGYRSVKAALGEKGFTDLARKEIFAKAAEEGLDLADYVPGFKSRNKAMNSKLFGKKIVEESIEKGASKGAAKGLASKFMRKTKGSIIGMNPWTATIFGLTGALVGGLTAGLDKKYTVDMDQLAKTDTYQQFDNMGLDVGLIYDEVFNK